MRVKPTPRAEKILVVDDDPGALALMRRLLERDGFSDVRATTCPNEGLQWFRTTWDPDLVILDLDMPGLDGFEVLRGLQEAKPSQLAETPVLMLTGESGHRNKLHALSLGARDFLAKPFDATELTIRVHGNLEIRALLKRAKQIYAEREESLPAQRFNSANLEMVESLMAALGYRDDPTRRHIKRISSFCRMIALAMNLDATFCQHIQRASAMHDVGNSRVPDHILLKAGKLSSDEREVMETHAQFGADLLAGSGLPVLDLAQEIALSHHEKWDGTGYPNGLQGSEIPLSARIVAVCDVFDALTSDRPYRKAWPVESAFAQIGASAGTHFDPDVVEAFFSVCS